MQSFGCIPSTKSLGSIEPSFDRRPSLRESVQEHSPVLKPPRQRARGLDRPGHAGLLHPVGEVEQAAVAVERVGVQLRGTTAEAAAMTKGPQFEQSFRRHRR